MASDDSRLHIVYNGEIYNHGVLKTDLEAIGHRFHSRCDTETLLRLFQAQGHKCVQRLRGMFAFAVWDTQQRELFLARDRFGVKPLYYVHTEDGSLFFASEIKALLAAGAVRPELNVFALPDYLANHSPSGEETLFKGVRRLPPGHTLLWREGHISIQRYWELPIADPQDQGRSELELVEEFSYRFDEAVRIRLMADVPLGVFLSGGIDSAAIAATMSRMVAGPVKTFSVAFAEREANELEYARLVSTRFRTEQHEVVVSARQFFDALPELIWHEDEPIAHPSSVPLYFVSRLAAEHVKVVLTGEGSDEMLGGYGRYGKTITNLRWGSRYESVVPADVRRWVRGSLQHLPRTSRAHSKISRSFLALNADLESLYFDNFAVFSRRRQAELLSGDLQDRLAGVDPYTSHRACVARASSAGLLDRLLYADAQTYLHELLMKQDQMSMAASLESRVPFLDHPLAEWLSTLPESMKLRGSTTKYILRKAMDGVLPARILQRPKMGFPVPFGSWVRGPYRSMIENLLLGEQALARGLFDPSAVTRVVREHMAGVDHSERIWSLANLELWQRRFVDGSTARPALTARVTSLR